MKHTNAFTWVWGEKCSRNAHLAQCSRCLFNGGNGAAKASFPVCDPRLLHTQHRKKWKEDTFGKGKHQKMIWKDV